MPFDRPVGGPFDANIQGTPDWVELVTPDPHAAASFYGALLGWEWLERPNRDGGTELVARQAGTEVAGIVAQPAELAGHPAFWNAYVAADRVEAVTDTVDLTVTATQIDLAGSTLTDASGSSGVIVSGWQRTSWIGVGGAGQSGARPFSLGPLPTAGPPGPYGESLGAGPAQTAGLPVDDGPLTERTDAAARAPEVLDDAPPHWNVYFEVVDLEASLAQADALGATLITPPFDAEDGTRVASLTDPQGALFSLRVSGPAQAGAVLS